MWNANCWFLPIGQHCAGDKTNSRTKHGVQLPGTDCLTVPYLLSFPTPGLSHPKSHGFLCGLAPTHPQSVSSITLSGHGHQGSHHSALQVQKWHAINRDYSHSHFGLFKLHICAIVYKWWKQHTVLLKLDPCFWTTAWQIYDLSRASKMWTHFCKE